MQNPKHIVITGASSGIGEALARLYARPSIRLGLIARRRDMLEQLAESCRQQGALVWTAAADVRNADELARLLVSQDTVQPIDLLIANAGISGGTFGAGESDAQARAIFSTNIDGVVNTVHPLLPRMAARRNGQIAIMASLAGFRGWPAAPAYSASKAAVRVYGEGLRGEYMRRGVRINVICPGYIDTPMTQANHFPMPFLISAEKGARIIANSLARNHARIAFPWPTAFAVWLLALLPPGWTDGLLAHLPKKGPLKST